MTQPDPANADLAFPKAGLTADALERIDAHFRQRIESGTMAGLVWGVIQHGEVIHRNAIGHADIEHGREMKLDTVFRLASMTKPLAAVALMMLFDERAFEIDDPISKYLPEFAQMSVLRTPDSDPDDVVPADRPITIRHVLQHTAGFGLGLGIGGTGEALLVKAKVYDRHDSLADEMSKLAKVPLSYQPGTLWNYSLAPDVQARLVEVFSGQAFDTFLQSRILDPLGMTDTAFALRPDMIDRLARVYWRPDRLVPWIEGSMPDLPPFIEAWPAMFDTLHDTSATYVRGSFGLSSTLDDYLRFAQMLSNGGNLGDIRILSQDTFRLMVTDSLGDIPMLWPIQGLGFGLGFAVLRDPATAGYAGSPGMFNWDGALGTIMWIDPVHDLAVVGMAQHLLVPDMTPDALGAEFRNLVYPALDQ